MLVCADLEAAIVGTVIGNRSRHTGIMHEGDARFYACRVLTLVIELTNRLVIVFTLLCIAIKPIALVNDFQFGYLGAVHMHGDLS